MLQSDSRTAMQPPTSCVFCGKDKDHVEKLFVAPTAAICDGCIDSIADILFEERRQVKAGGQFEGTGSVPHELVGKWRKPPTPGSPEVRWRVLPEGLLISSFLENGENRTMLMRFRIEGNVMIYSELLASRNEKRGTFDVERNVMTVDGKVVFERCSE